MRILWDEDKNRRNVSKHGLGFEAASLVFDDPFHRSVQDRHKEGEERWRTIGLAGGEVVIVVAHTVQDTDADETVRIISARKATSDERNRYEESND